MSTERETEQSGISVLRRYEIYGLFVGLGAGLLVGVMYSGPNFHTWSLSTSLWVILGCAVGGAGIGWLAPMIATSSATGGYGIGGWFGSDGHSGPGDHSGGGCGDSGSGGNDGGGGGTCDG